MAPSFELPSIRALASFATQLLAQSPLGGGSTSGIDSSSALSSAPVTPFASSVACPIDGPLSCHSSSGAEDTCCYISPGGLLLQTQFWDARPSIGPDRSWTLHGLWPDNCDGSFEQFCHRAPQFHNITQILQAAGQHELLDYMLTYWLPNRGSAERFWQHEWNKHGTCINTLNRACYGDAYEPGIEVVDFFARAVAVFKSLDTYEALASAGIIPTEYATYEYDEIVDALTAVTGYPAYIDCAGKNLNQVWYFYNVRGSLQTGDFVPIDPPHVRSRCPRRGIRYIPKL